MAGGPLVRRRPGQCSVYCQITWPIPHIHLPRRLHHRDRNPRDSLARLPSARRLAGLPSRERPLVLPERAPLLLAPCRVRASGTIGGEHPILVRGEEPEQPPLFWEVPIGDPSRGSDPEKASQ